MVRTVGWAFLAGFTIDAIGTFLSVTVPPFSMASGVISTIMLLFATAIFILACIGTLLPRKVFLTLPMFYAALLVFQTVVGILLVAKLPRGEMPPLLADSTYIAKYIPWYPNSLLVAVALQLGLAIFGMVAFAKSGPVADDRA